MPQRKGNKLNTAALGYMPKAFPKFLARHDSDFAKLGGKDRCGMASALWHSGGNPNHKALDDCFTLHWRYIERLFTRARHFHDINASLGWFVQEARQDYRNHVAKAWKLSDKAKGLYMNYLEVAHTVRESDLDKGFQDSIGQAYRMDKEGIRSRMVNGTTKSRYPRGAIKSTVEVDGDSLHFFHGAAQAYIDGETCPQGYTWAFEHWESIRKGSGPNSGLEAAERRAEKARDQASIMLDIAKRSGVPGYVIPIKYHESTAGRLYAEGGANLQNCVSEVRRAALKGCYDVDIENCHFALLDQLARKLGQPVPSISDYLTRKKAVRNEIALAAGIRVDEAKVALLALLFGASLDKQDGELADTLGTEVLERLKACELLRGLASDLNKVRKVVIDHYRNQSQKAAVIVNDAGREISTSEPVRQQLAHILQGAESVALEAMIDDLRGNIALLQHDGITVYEKPNLPSLEGVIEEATGFSLRLSAEAL